MSLDPREVGQMRDRYMSLVSDHPLAVLRRRSALQLCMYNFLEKPKGALAQLYHFGIFGLIILVYILSVVGEYSAHELLPMVQVSELFLAFYLFAEFFARLWAVGAVAKYSGVQGRLAYLCRPICLVDLVVLGASTFVLFDLVDGDNPVEQPGTDPSNSNGTAPLLIPVSGTGTRTALAVLPASFVSMDKLRFLQILRLLHIDRQMSTWALVRNMVQRSRFELLAAYYIALMIFLTLAVCVFTTEQQQQDGQEERTFQNLGDSFWFSIVTVLTIGYGDLVPREWTSKLAVCFFSYLGLSVFSAASGLVGVGMSLLLSNERQQKQRRKLRDMAARLIQSWYRFRMITDEQRFYTMRIFRRQCVRMRHAEERIRRARAIAAENANKKSVRKLSNSLLARVLLKRAEKRETSPIAFGGTVPIIPEESSAEGGSDADTVGQSADEERILDYLYYSQHSGSNSASSKSEHIGGRTDDDPRCGRYRALLRMCYFFIFITLRRKFKKARGPCELANAERELGEMEHQRMQRLKELEARLDALLGMRGDRMALVERMELYERKMVAMEQKSVEMERMAQSVLEMIIHRQEHHQQRELLEETSVKVPNPRRTYKPTNV